MKIIYDIFYILYKWKFKYKVVVNVVMDLFIFYTYC